MKKLLRVLDGEAMWPPPVWLLRQAGRYLPEYWTLRAAIPDFMQRVRTPEVAVEITLQPLRRFGMDAAIVFSDILIIPVALGQQLRLVEHEGPKLPPIRTAEDVAALDPTRVEGFVAPVMETLRRLSGLVGEAALVGFAGSPFTVACYMVEGGGSKDFVHTRTMAYRDPAAFGRLIEVVTEATIGYLLAQIEAGAEAVMLFDTWAGILPPAQFRAHVVAPTARIVAALRARFPSVPVIGFPRLSGMLLGEYAAATGVQAVHMDTATDCRLAAGLVPEHVALQGNVDPLVLLAGGAALAEATRAAMAALRGRPHIMNLGHGIVPQTPLEHVGAFVAQVQAA